MEYRGERTPVSQDYRERRHGSHDEERRQDLSPRLSLLTKLIIYYPMASTMLVYATTRCSTTLHNGVQAHFGVVAYDLLPSERRFLKTTAAVLLLCSC